MNVASKPFNYVLLSGIILGFFECLLLSIPFWLGYSVFHHDSFLLYSFFRACLLFGVFWLYKERVGIGVLRLKTGVLITLFVFLISTIVYVAYFNYFVVNISPGYISKLREYEHERLVSEGASGARIGYIETFATPAMLSTYSVVGMFVSYFFIGLVLTILMCTKDMEQSIDSDLI